MPATDDHKQNTNIPHIEDATSLITIFLVAIKNFILNELRAPYLYYDAELEAPQDAESVKIAKSKAKRLDEILDAEIEAISSPNFLKYRRASLVPALPQEDEGGVRETRAEEEEEEEAAFIRGVNTNRRRG